MAGRPRLHPLDAHGRTPWQALGISERTWYYRQQAQQAADTPDNDELALNAFIAELVEEILFLRACLDHLLGNKPSAPKQGDKRTWWQLLIDEYGRTAIEDLLSRNPVNRRKPGK